MDVYKSLEYTKPIIHVISSGAGSLVQHELYKTPGASSWLSGATFPYDPDETMDVLGFKPNGLVNEEVSIQLACVAYMKAYRFGRDDAIGIGMTSSVASLKPHRGDHRIHATIITSTSCASTTKILEKGVGYDARQQDNDSATKVAFNLLAAALGSPHNPYDFHVWEPQHLTDVILQHPVFLDTGKRSTCIPVHSAIMPGAYNPPHEGHFGLAEAVFLNTGYRVAHQVTIDPPHKDAMTGQKILERAKMLAGHTTVFSCGDPLYIQKAERYRTPIVLGADALLRMFDPKWGVDVTTLLERLTALGTKIFVSGRKVDGEFLTLNEVLKRTGIANFGTFKSIPGDWDISSTEVRNALLQNR